ncbi:MAG: HNH endonuclease [Bacteroidia bacterium]
MINLNSETIQASSVAHLSLVQNQIINESTFEAQAKKANAKWSSKASGTGKAAFKDIRNTLIRMCVGVEICVYCEQNEATDIEHIFPKKLYPEKAFAWDNYVLACSKCNTHHKSDKFKIFNPKNSTTAQDVTPARGTFTKPANDDALFINQRIENPLDFLELDLVNQQFVFTEKFAAGTREYLKAKYTKDLLGLNTRAALVANRKNAAKFFISRLEKYVAAKNAQNFQDLINAINDDWGAIDKNKNFANAKQGILDSIKNDILSYSHPTVWKELIRQRQKLPKTNTLLNQAPEALNW